jgi:rod shape determining protein RodA
LGAFALLLARLFRLTRLARENVTSFLILGFIAVLFLQVLVNVGMNLGMFPVTGIGLPFVSYGGSSLIFFLFFIGVAESIMIRSMRLAQNIGM